MDILVVFSSTRNQYFRCQRVTILKHKNNQDIRAVAIILLFVIKLL